jgi:hypothetical protein
MAVSNGENVSNIVGSAVLSLPQGELTSNVVGSAVLALPQGVVASNIVGSAVLAYVVFAPPVWDSSLTLSNGTVGVAYSQSGAWCSGASPITYSLAFGSPSLPPGLTLSSSGGAATLSGTPTVAGTYTFRLAASNAFGSNVISQTFTITIAAPSGGASGRAWVC